MKKGRGQDGLGRNKFGKIERKVDKRSVLRKQVAAQYACLT